MKASIFSPQPSFDPWWWEAAPPAATIVRDVPSAADVAIIGAGYTGLSAALTLARAGRSVVVLEAGDPGEGASSRNGGMLGSGHKVSFAAMSARYGHATAVAIIKEGLASLVYTVDLIRREDINCHFSQTGRFRAAFNVKHYDSLGREADFLRKELGVEVDMVPRAEQHREVATDVYHGGCVYHQHGTLHPALFHKGLLDRVVAAGATVIGRTPVTTIERINGGFSVITDRTPLTVGNVIAATNGYTGTVTPQLRRRVVPVPSFIIATEPLSAETINELIPNGRMIVETRRLHCYYRISPDGRRMLFGGRASLLPMDTRKSAKRLYDIMVKLFPQLANVRISHSWTGFVAFSRDHLAHVGVNDGIHFAMGYCGSGVAMAPYLGYKTAQKILGSPEGKTAFDETKFAAIPLYRGHPWFLRFLDPYYRITDLFE
ncbi:MAG: FAD-binding oxidoreductase [Proteobacteria bacterium]|nr:MAG: FAD-binding oxidoreductase [Pseudomonadota bacterium]